MHLPKSTLDTLSKHRAVFLFRLVAVVIILLAILPFMAFVVTTMMTTLTYIDQQFGLSILDWFENSTMGNILGSIAGIACLIGLMILCFALVGFAHSKYKVYTGYYHDKILKPFIRQWNASFTFNSDTTITRDDFLKAQLFLYEPNSFRAYNELQGQLHSQATRICWLNTRYGYGSRTDKRIVFNGVWVEITTQLPPEFSLAVFPHDTSHVMKLFNWLGHLPPLKSMTRQSTQNEEFNDLYQLYIQPSSSSNPLITADIQTLLIQLATVHKIPFRFRLDNGTLYLAFAQYWNPFDPSVFKKIDPEEQLKSIDTIFAWLDSFVSRLSDSAR